MSDRLGQALSPKNEIRDRPKIAQISLMTEAEKLALTVAKILPEQKNRGKDPDFSSLTLNLCHL
jgi:hypothetical protein